MKSKLAKWTWLGYAVGTAAALLVDPAAAQTGFVDTTGYGFVSMDGPIVLNQAFGPGQNIAGIVQLAPNPTATVTQSGFYNRTAIIQVDANNTANITQFGDYSHAYVIQVGPTNASAIAQTGNNGSAIVIQLAASPIAALGTGYLERVASNLLFAPETAADTVSIDSPAQCTTFFARPAVAARHRPWGGLRRSIADCQSAADCQGPADCRTTKSLPGRAVRARQLSPWRPCRRVRLDQIQL
jgi:hypothetical protein